jgi:hypothetical protein
MHVSSSLVWMENLLACTMQIRHDLAVASLQPDLCRIYQEPRLISTCCVEYIICTHNVTPHTRKSSLTTSEGRIRGASRLLQLAALHATMRPRTFHNLHGTWGTSLYFSVWPACLNARRGSSEARSELLVWRFLCLVEDERYRRVMIRGT